MLSVYSVQKEDGYNAGSRAELAITNSRMGVRNSVVDVGKLYDFVRPSIVGEIC